MVLFCLSTNVQEKMSSPSSRRDVGRQNHVLIKHMALEPGT